MSKVYSLLMNIKVDTKETSDGKDIHSYSFKAWKDGKITEKARAFNWTEPIVKKQSGNMQKLGEQIFSVIQDMEKNER